MKFCQSTEVVTTLPGARPQTADSVRARADAREETETKEGWVFRCGRLEAQLTIAKETIQEQQKRIRALELKNNKLLSAAKTWERELQLLHDGI